MNPLLLLHGALGSTRQVATLKNALTLSHSNIMSMDFSGHGRTPFSKAGFGIDVFADEIMSFLNHHDVPFVDVFGYSMGGYVALTAALQWPSRFRKIAVFGTKFDWSPAQARVEVQKLNPDKILEKVPQFAAQLQQEHGDPEWKMLLKETGSMMNALGERPGLDENTLGAIQQEVLILAGDKDTMAPASVAEKIAQQIPFGSYHLLSDTPHPIDKVNIVQLRQVLNDFFR